MNFPKSIFILAILICACNLNMVAQNKSDHFNIQKLNQFLSKNDLYQATLLLNEDITYAKKHQLPEPLADTYHSLGKVFSQMGSYKTAEVYYLKAFDLYDSLNISVKIDEVLKNLSKSYMSDKNYEKFDSLFPIAQKSAVKLNSWNIYYNFESKLNIHYAEDQNEVVIKLADEALNNLKNFPFDTIIQPHKSSEKQRLRSVFQYFKAISLVKNKDSDTGYPLLLNIDEKAFKENVGSEFFPYSKIATYNYYKFKYFNEYKKQADSANHYLLISDTYKYNAIKDFERKTSKNGELIYKVINTENQLKLTKELREKDKKISTSFLIATIVLTLLLFVLTGFSYHYYSNRKRINLINLKLKEYNKKLLDIDKERLEFFSILSHELRTPIYGINGLATLIKQEPEASKKLSYLNSLVSSSNYLSILIDNVLQATKLKFEDKTLILKSSNIRNVLLNITNTIKLSAENKGLDLITNTDNADIDEFILLDKVALSQILINLAYNSIRYTEQGFLSISITEQSRTSSHVSLLFEIKDSGIGIKDEHRDIVFKAFENKSFLNKNSSGSGLGLYIVKTLLKSYHTSIDFTSKPKEGSNFFFTISFEIGKTPINTNKTNHSISDRIHRVLIVDDNKINLMITQKNVERIPDFICSTASNGKDAIRFAKNNDFDLILMDINMPDMDGFEATKQIRLFNTEIPILALTALNSGEITKKAEISGMNQVITKPYNVDDFISTILSFSSILQE